MGRHVLEPGCLIINDQIAADEFDLVPNASIPKLQIEQSIILLVELRRNPTGIHFVLNRDLLYRSQFMIDDQIHERREQSAAPQQTARCPRGTLLKAWSRRRGAH